jgi:hypothetical protein
MSAILILPVCSFFWLQISRGEPQAGGSAPLRTSPGKDQVI